MQEPLLGWLAPSERPKSEQDEHEAFIAASPRFSLSRPTVPKGTKIILRSFLKRPEVLLDTKVEFTGFRQLTGSCVGVSTGNAIATLSAVQRLLTDSPTKALIPWWPFAYGRCRALSGFRGRGEGAITSRMLRVLMQEGVDDKSAAFNMVDGFSIPKSDELAWSDGNSALVQERIPNASQFPLGSIAVLSSIDEVAANLLNGYPVLNGCDYYPGRVSAIRDGVALLRYDSRGGHATTFEGYWEHPTLGPLYLYCNQWDGSTYRADPDLPRCSGWMLESEAARLFRLGGNNGETMALSSLTYFPAQPKLLDWSLI